MTHNVVYSSEASGSIPTIKSSDPGWKHCIPVGIGTNKVQCKYCMKIMSAGITRDKEHLMRISGKVAPCTKCPEDVRKELLEYQNEKNSSQLPIPIRTSVNLGFEFEEEDDEVEAGAQPPSQMITPPSQTITAPPSQKQVKGPMDLFIKNPAKSIEQRNKGKLRQVNIRESIDKEAVARVHQYIARFWYQAGLSFNAITLKSFEDMVEAIGTYGRNLLVPSYHAIRVPLLNKELEYTNNLLVSHKEEWKRHGCSIMSDGWTDRKQRTIINFLVNSPSGTVFVKSIDGSNIVKIGEKLFKMLDSLVDEIGEENVVQVVTDNGSNYVAAGKMLMEKRKHLYWTPCVAHYLDLMLEDIGKIPVIKRTIQRGVKLVGFIYSHTSTLSLLRRFTNKRELVRPAVTRFATSFLSLERIHKEKGSLRKMFASEEWTQNKLTKEAKGREATKTVVMPSFWKNVVFTLKVMAPLVRVLRFVDGDKRPAMGYIYEAMEKAKEIIAKSFENNESRYKDVFSIIDNRWDCQLHRPLHAAGHLLNPEIYYKNQNLKYDLEVTNGLFDCVRKFLKTPKDQDQIVKELGIYKAGSDLFGDPFAQRHISAFAPAEWWSMYGHSTPNLQQHAIKILGLTCSASGCEHNWSVFEQIHTKKRNRLEHKKLHDLVYIKYNQKLYERHSRREEIDPISLDDIDVCNEWLTGEIDNEDDVGEDLVFEDDTLDWQVVHDASGAGEPEVRTRSTTGKRKVPSTDGSHVARARVKNSKKGRSSSVSRGTRVTRVEQVVEEDDVDDVDEEELALEDDEHERIYEPSEGEEEEGYASLDDKEDDYVTINEED